MAVTPQMLAVALGMAAPEADSIQEQQWQLWIDDATMLIENRSAQLGGVEIDEVKFDYVVREAVVAHIKRPDDATQVTTSIDDGSSSRTYRSGKGRVSILDEWWTMLGLTDPKGAFALDMAPARGRHAPYCNLMFRGAYCSCGANIAGTPIYEPSW